jgi:AbrB family looped-hinge helix DNA binding protein
MKVTVSQNGSILLPAELREKYSLVPGTRLHINDYGGVLSLIPARTDPIEAGVGLLKGDTSLTQALLDDRQGDRERQ